MSAARIEALRKLFKANRGRVFTVDELAVVLWPNPNMRPETYGTIVYQMVMRLRREGTPVKRITGYKL